LTFIVEDIQELRKILFDPQSANVCLWLPWMHHHGLMKELNEWLGEKNAADTLSQSVPNNVTSEMGLALLDVADMIRPYPEVI
jgi:phosphoenolpyruvate synthase/pyruvate phosphate dikinase